MNPFRLYECVQALQSEFDTTRLSINGVNVWMIIRLIMLGRLSAEANRRLSSMHGLVSHTGVLHNAAVALTKKNVSPSNYDVRSFDRAAILMTPKSERSVDADCGFYELPADYTLVEDGVAINRIADSFVEAFGSRIRKFCRFSTPILTIEKRSEPTLVLSTVGDWSLPARELQRFRIAVREFCALAHARFPAFAPQQTEILRVSREVLRYADAHEVWLKELGLKTMFLQCFVSFEKYAVLLACKRAGIVTVDVQHGYCDAFSIYNDLPSTTSTDVTLFPDVMWTWGETTTRALTEDTARSGVPTRIVMGGDVWGTLVQTRAAGLADQLRADIGADRYERRIVVTFVAEALLQGDNVKLLPENLYTAIKTGPPTWLWMLRVHPRSLHLVEPLNAMMAEEGFENVEVSASSYALVEAAIEVADIYLTGFSVSALEANTRGKTVLITDDIGKQLFAELISDGIFESVTTARDIVAAVAAARPPAGDAHYYTRDMALTRAAFERIKTFRAEPVVAPLKAEIDTAAATAVAEALIELAARASVPAPKSLVAAFDATVAEVGGEALVGADPAVDAAVVVGATSEGATRRAPMNA